MTTESRDIIFVAVLPTNTPSVELKQKAAAIIGKSLYITQLLLAGKVPRIVASYNDITIATNTVKALQELGLSAITCNNKETRRNLNCCKAHTIRFEETGITYWDHDGHTRIIEARDVFLIIKGTIEFHEETEISKTNYKLNLPATLLSGGIPIRRKVTEKTKEFTSRTEAFLRIYFKEPPEANIELIQSDIDYSCLGKETAATSTENIEKIANKIRNIFSKAAFDERMTRYFAIDIPVSNPWEKINVVCNLINLFSRISRKTEPTE